MDGFRSILLPVAEAERLVDSFRRAGDWSHGHGVPAHLTIAGPWSLETGLPLADLSRMAKELRGTHFELGSAGPLGSALCLFPTDDGPLLALRERVLDAVGVPDQVDDNWRLHLTVSRRESAPAEDDGSLASLRKSLPIVCTVGDPLVAEQDGAGRMTLRHI